MKKTLKSIIAVGTTAMFIITVQTGCKKTITSEQGNEQSQERLLTNKQIEEIGLLHNKYLSAMFKETNFKNGGFVGGSGNTKFLKKVCSSIEVKELNEVLKDSLTNKIYDLNYLEDNISNKLVIDVIQTGIKAADSSLNYFELHSKIKEFKADASIALMGKDLDIALVYLEVLDNSALFWFSKFDGGCGQGEIVLNNIRKSNNLTISRVSKPVLYGRTVPKPSGFGRRLLVSDAMGAAGVFTSYGLLAGFTGPMGIGALTASVAVGSAWASGATALGI